MFIDISVHGNASDNILPGAFSLLKRAEKARNGC